VLQLSVEDDAPELDRCPFGYTSDYISESGSTIVVGVVRIIFDLKLETRPQLFALAQYTLGIVVLDLYPLTPVVGLWRCSRKTPSRWGYKPQSYGISVKRPTGRKADRTADNHRPRPGTAEDPGAIGQRGPRKNVVLIARKLKALLDAEPGMRAVMTRGGGPGAARVARERRRPCRPISSFRSTPTRSVNTALARGIRAFRAQCDQRGGKWLAQRECGGLIGGVNLGGRDPMSRALIIFRRPRR
jgi:N-acetylmuramoyl-L-alanine amidase